MTNDVNFEEGECSQFVGEHVFVDSGIVIFRKVHLLIWALALYHVYFRMAEVAH